MKNKDKKMLLFVIATVVTSLGIGYTLLKGTRATTDVPPNEAFDDMNFYKCVVDAYNDKNDTDYDYTTYSLSDEELSVITTLHCIGIDKSDDEKIKSVKGIEQMTALTYLNVYDNQLTELDISKNVTLTELDVKSNVLTELDVSNNIALKELRVDYNQLTELDVSNNTSLTDLSVNNNQLTKLDVSNNTTLKDLSVGSNQLTGLDVSKNTALTKLWVYYNKLTKLDVSQNKVLKFLDVRNNQLTVFNVSNNIALTELGVSDNQLTELDVSNNIGLTELNVGGNQLTELDVSKNTALTYLSVDYNQLIELDVSNNTSLTKLYAYKNQLTKLDVSQNTSLTKLSIYENQLTELDVSQNTALTDLSVSNNQLTELDVSNNISLTGLYAYKNQLTNLNAKGAEALKYLYVYDNKLTNLNVEGAISLTTLYADSNQLTELDVSQSKLLQIVSVYENQLTNLDVSNNIALEKLDVDNNKLANLDVSQNIVLELLDVSNNQLTSLDVSNNTVLNLLDVRNNQLTSLDLSKNTLFTGNKEGVSYTMINGHAVIKISPGINNNPYNEEKYVYVNENIFICSNIKLPSHLYSSEANWVSNDSDVVKVNEDGTIDAVNLGTADIIETLNNFYIEYTTTTTINVVEITSDKYIVDEENSYIVIGNDSDVDIIKSNIKVSNENVSVDVDSVNKKIYVKYQDEILKVFNIIDYNSSVYDLSKDYIYVGFNDFNVGNINVSNINDVNVDFVLEEDKLLVKYNDLVLDEYEIVGIKFNSYSVVGKTVLVKDEVSYDNFINDITMSDGITYKISDTSGEVISGNIVKDMIFKVYYNSDEVGSYIISDDYLEFNESINVDEDNKIIGNIEHGLTINDMLDMIETNGSVSVLDKDDNELDTTGKIKTGDKFKVNLSGQTLIYSVSVMGDVNGDGNINRDDIELSSKHIIKGNLITGSEYLKAIDMDNNNITNINDIIKMVKKIKN